MLYEISRYLLWLFFKICFNYRVRRAENFPKKGPYVIASNHLSFLDPGIVGVAVRGRQVSFLARADLFANSLFNWWGRNVGAIPIKRGRFDLSAIRGSFEKLRQGGIVSLFPEGTRSKDGTIKDPKGGVGFLAAKAGVPVVPVFIKGSDKALPHHAMFIRFKPVEIIVGEPLKPGSFVGKGGECDYQALSQEVMRRIESFSRA